MKILAIETSCDETAAAVVTDGRAVESNVISSQIDVHRATGGIVPEVAARLQLETIIPVIEQALEEAGAGWKQIDAIAVTAGPGLVGSLIVGVETAKALALAKDKPLIPVNHLAGHLYACFQDDRVMSSRAKRSEDPGSRRRHGIPGQARNDYFEFPYLGLVVSGGHTELVTMTGHHRFELLGSTRDDAAGEAFDKVGKLLGLPYPGGPEISKLAKQGNPKGIDFPRPMLNQDNFDFSYSGLKTDVRREVAAKRLTAKRKADLAASFEAAAVDVLVTKTKRAAAQFKPSAVLLGGGVAANRLLRGRLDAALAKERIRLLITPPELATDNAAMIGLAAYWQPDDGLTGAARFGVFADPSVALASPTGS